MSNTIHSIKYLDSGTPDKINVVVEIPRGSNLKYEVDEETGMLFVDRKLFTAMYYPCNYGFIPSTLEGDGDPVDVLVLGEFSVHPMSVIRAHPVGILFTEDEEGQDSKVVAVPINKIDPTFSNVKDVNDISEPIRKQIEHFFEHYKELEGGKYVKIAGWGNKNEAEQRISEAMANFKKNSI